MNKLLAPGLIALALSAAPSAWAASSVSSLEEIAAAPFTLEVAAAARADTVAWVVAEAGHHTLYVATGPDYRPRSVVVRNKDDGLPIGNVALSPDGRLLTYTLGVDDVVNGRTPNPASLTQAVRLTPYVVAAAGGEPVAIDGPMGGVAFDPAGRGVGYSMGRTFVTRTVSLSPGGRVEVGAPVVAFTDIFGVGEFVWSPAGDALAFVSPRHGHSLVGVWRPGAERITWMGPSIGADGDLGWSADGRSVAFRRRPGGDYTRQYDVMTNFPFSIVVADARTGAARELYRSAPKDGSDVESYTPVRWTAHGKVLFLSDRSGFSHVQALDPATGEVRALTQGACDVEAMRLDASRTTLVLTSNCADPYRRDVSTLDLASGARRQVSAVDDIADQASFVGESRDLLFRSADFRTPQTPAIAGPSGAPRRIAPPMLSASVAAFRKPEVVRLKAADGTPLTGVLFRPPGAGKSARGLVYVHGGPIRQMMPGWHVRPYYATAYANNQHLAAQGYTVLAINYRLGTGFGRDFRTVEGYGPHGQKELQDIVAAGEYLKAQPGMNPAIGIYGGSIGGYLTASALAKHSDLFRAGVAWHGIYDWTQWIRSPTPDMNFTPWGVEAANMDILKASSPVYNVSTWTSPVLLIGGDDDRNIHFPEFIQLVKRLTEKGVDVEALVLPNADHSFSTQSGWNQVLKATDDFLLRRLPPR